jgi:DNA-binding NarL/FixJ family response regulator
MSEPNDTNHRVRKTRVLVLDNQSLLRSGLVALLEKFSDMAVVGASGLGKHVHGLIRECQPDVVLLCLDEAGFKGLRLVTTMVRKFPKVRILVGSSYVAEEHILKVFATGATGYLLKKSAPEQLGNAIRATARGETFLCPEIPARTRRACLRKLRNGAASSSGLTRRQSQILQAIAESKSSKEIAALLGLSPKTVEYHRAQLMARLGIRDVPGLVRYAVRIGVVSIEDPA